MWWLIQNILFSVCLIVIIHYLYIYFETTLTSPKVKDFIHSPKQEYKVLLESIHKKMDGKLDYMPHPPPPPPPPPPEPSMTGPLLPLAPHPPPTETLGINNHNSTDDMKMDLKEYIRELALKTNTQMN